MAKLPARLTRQGSATRWPFGNGAAECDRCYLKQGNARHLFKLLEEVIHVLRKNHISNSARPQQLADAFTICRQDTTAVVLAFPTSAFRRTSSKHSTASAEGSYRVVQQDAVNMEREISLQ